MVEEIVSGTVAGIAAALVIEISSLFRAHYNRPVLSAALKRNGSSLELILENKGRTSFKQVLLNIVGFAQGTIESKNASPVDASVQAFFPATWSPEGDKIRYNHRGPILPQTKVRFQFTVIDDRRLPDAVTLALFHAKGKSQVLVLKIE